MNCKILDCRKTADNTRVLITVEYTIAGQKKTKTWTFVPEAFDNRNLFIEVIKKELEKEEATPQVPSSISSRLAGLVNKTINLSSKKIS